MPDYLPPIEDHIKITVQGLSLIELLAKHHSQISKQKLKKALSFGAVWLTKGKQANRIRRAKKELLIGDEVHLYYDESILFKSIQPAHLVADEVAYSVWNKPCGMFSQGSKWGDHSSICRWIELNQMPNRQCYLVHRLDRATSGLMLVAHSKKITAKLALLFEERLVDKRYKAIVFGEYKADEYPQKVESEIDGRKAVTIILESKFDPNKNHSELNIKLETGRKHQIRKHLSGLGYSIIGDRLYGDYTAEEVANANLPDLQLQSYQLSFKCPISEQVKSFEV